VCACCVCVCMFPFAPIAKEKNIYIPFSKRGTIIKLQNFDNGCQKTVKFAINSSIVVLEKPTHQCNAKVQQSFHLSFQCGTKLFSLNVTFAYFEKKKSLTEKIKRYKSVFDYMLLNLNKE